MARSLNKVQLIGNLTRDPELRYTPQGTAVCTFGLATNRQWSTDSGEKKEDVEFHRVVAWNKLAELCAQLMAKGRKVYLEGRLQTRKWTGQDGNERQTTEIVLRDMVLLDSRGSSGSSSSDDQVDDFDIPDEGEEVPDNFEEEETPSKGGSKKSSSKSSKPSKSEKSSEVADDDIPF